ncbi:TIGR01777 family oxidoreductase [Pseudactinotalea suaedae]|uniref:TIGR01777 family oxidoreductase n=1 Tax=Pseudactinotalea suaedae TaxID=1524924 RepID=UPI0012E1607B|nr:TIGR01777 family oxidoreductase [Pseudactinotalea suaedae]
MSRIRTAVVAGASGYIGRYLTARLRHRGTQVRTIGRGAAADARWGDDAEVARVLEGADVLINLAGRSVSCRYNKRNADLIFSSRVRTTAQLARALHLTASAPPVWISSSTGTIYRDARDRPQDERDGELGSGFSVEVARAWERELAGAPAHVRTVALRMSIVLGAGGGAINPIINLTRMGFGGPMGDGGQMFSWVHVEDVARAIDHLCASPDRSGPVNVATPNPVTNAELMAQMREVFGAPFGIPEPRWLLELGGRVIRTEPELVLKSRWVHPGVLLEDGFTFRFPELREALQQIASRTRAGLLPVQLG